MAKLELEPKWLRRRCPNELFQLHRYHLYFMSFPSFQKFRNTSGTFCVMILAHSPSISGTQLSCICAMIIDSFSWTHLSALRSVARRQRWVTHPIHGCPCEASRNYSTPPAGRQRALCRQLRIAGMAHIPACLRLTVFAFGSRLVCGHRPCDPRS